MVSWREQWAKRLRLRYFLTAIGVFMLGIAGYLGLLLVLFLGFASVAGIGFLQLIVGHSATSAFGQR